MENQGCQGPHARPWKLTQPELATPGQCEGATLPARYTGCQSTDDSANATLTHSAMTFASHKVDTEVLVVSKIPVIQSTPKIALLVGSGFGRQ